MIYIYIQQAHIQTKKKKDEITQISNSCKYKNQMHK